MACVVWQLGQGGLSKTFVVVFMLKKGMVVIELRIGMYVGRVGRYAALELWELTIDEELMEEVFEE